MSIAVFPGSFDPPTNGHLNIIQRASTMFDSIDVVIAVNSEKKYLFSQEERFSMLKELVKPYKNVTVHIWEGLIVNYAKKTGAKILLRGIRNTIDFSYEFELSLMNHNLNNEIETLFIPTDQKYLLLKSSSIKELARFGGNISEMVPPFVE
ncbi:MAG: pantetheine-phosphate adenylyltransferase, partial [Treponema sp.]|nr:pantetheine-phosphate adenylyltransferase [Treponema sp.]MBQ5632248.1 pantetheine-phosphate adenylyltransferase [Treponema sp.]